MKTLLVLYRRTTALPDWKGQKENSKNLKTTNASINNSRPPLIPMRDGVKLHTVILVPRSARNAPILLTRTPYDADRR